jgi:hypothetical protein
MQYRPETLRGAFRPLGTWARSSRRSGGRSMAVERLARESPAVCPFCNGEIEEEAVVVYRHGELIYMRCWEGRATGPRR